MTVEIPLFTKVPENSYLEHVRRLLKNLKRDRFERDVNAMPDAADESKMYARMCDLARCDV